MGFALSGSRRGILGLQSEGSSRRRVRSILFMFFMAAGIIRK